MNSIDPHRFYSAEELNQILFGKVSIELLRRHGLRGLQDGYYGQNVHDALMNYLGSKFTSTKERRHESD